MYKFEGEARKKRSFIVRQREDGIWLVFRENGEYTEYSDQSFKAHFDIIKENTPNKIEDHTQLLRLVKHFEGFYPKAYKDPVGIWTIGYGTIKYSNGRSVKAGDTITEREAIEEMLYELKEKRAGIRKLVTSDLNTNQLDALTSFAYNVGVGAFKNSTLRTCINNRDYEEAKHQFMRWIKAGGKPLKGLWRRRLAESLLFQGILERVPTKVPSNYADIKSFPANWKDYL